MNIARHSLPALLLCAAGAAAAQTFSLESAVLDSRSARNLGVTTERGELASLFRAQKAMTFGILRASGISLDALPAEVRARIERFQTTNIEAFRSFAQGLELKDQGKYAEAREAFRRAAELDPGFALALEQQQAMPDVNVLSHVQLRAVVAAAAGAAVDRGKAAYAVDLARAVAALQAGQTVVTINLPAVESSSAGGDKSAYTANPPGSGVQHSPNLAAAIAYRYASAAGPVIGLTVGSEFVAGQYHTAGGVLESLQTTDASGARFQALRGGATAVPQGAATLGDGTRVSWGQWLSAPGASAAITVNQQFVSAPTLGPVDFMFGEATRQMPNSGVVSFTPGGGSLSNVSGTISVNFPGRTIGLNNLGFTIDGLVFSGLSGSATMIPNIASGAFRDNYSAGQCSGCVAFSAQSSAFGGNFVGRAAEGLVFSTIMLTGDGTSSGTQLFRRP